MSDSEFDVDKFTLNGLLRVYQVPSLTDYRPRDFHIRENGLENTPSSYRAGSIRQNSAMVHLQN
jgi:hypothetical protein